MYSLYRTAEEPSRGSTWTSRLGARWLWGRRDLYNIEGGDLGRETEKRGSGKRCTHATDNRRPRRCHPRRSRGNWATRRFPLRDSDDGGSVETRRTGGRGAAQRGGDSLPAYVLLEHIIIGIRYSTISWNTAMVRCVQNGLHGEVLKSFRSISSSLQTCTCKGS
jgi:hypothetical protein